MDRKLSIGILVISFLPTLTFAQLFEVKLSEKVSDCSRLVNSFSDSTLWVEGCKSLESCLLNSGYLSFQSDTAQVDSIQIITYHPGQQWELTFLTDASETSEFSQRNQSLQLWANSGHPFAQIVVDSIWMGAEEIRVVDHITPGPEVRYDSIPQGSEFKIPRGFLKYHFGLEEGELFNQSVIDQLTLRSNQLEFLSFQRTPALLFTEKGSWVFLYPKKQKANRFDLLIGFNNSEAEGTAFSGQADIRLVNSFKTGEWIGIKWQAPPDGAQQLELELGLPYLSGSRFWLETELDLYRRDSSFLNIDAGAKVRYAHKANAGVALTYRAQRSRVGVSEEGTGLSSVDKDLWGLELKVDQRNDVFSPNSGTLYRLEGSAGQRRSEGENETQYRLDAEVDAFIGLGGRHVFRPRLQAAALLGTELSTNELFRIGGRNSLRGFPEQSLFTSRYGIATFEYRYRLESTTYFQMFADGAIRESIEGSFDDFYGLGAGISLLLSNAYIQMDIAVPNSGNGFDFRSAVLHLGYAGRF